MRRWIERHWTAICWIVALLLCARWIGEISEDPIRTDGIANARMAVNLAHHGVLSQQAVPSPAPTHYREPLPPITAALGVLAADAVMGRAPIDAYLTGARAKYLKFSHVAWKALSVLAAYFLILGMTSSPAAALIGAVLAGTSQPHVDTLFTEVEAAALITTGTLLFLAGLRRRSLSLIALAGACFGLMALTKAVFLYVFIGFVVVVPIVLYLLRRGESPQWIGRMLAVLVAAFAVVTLPWMYRNLVHFGGFEISGRSGIVLYTRAVKNGMTWDEYKGAFYVWSPERLRGAMGKLMGLSNADLQRGERLQRLNRTPSDFSDEDLKAELSGEPEAAISYYRKARAERVRLAERFAAAGHPHPQYAADKELRSRALEAFKSHPLKHLAMTLPFLWRGAGLYTPVLLVALIYAIRVSHRDLLLVTLLALGYVMIHALFTHFEPRYATPLVPLVVSAGMVPLTSALMRRARRRAPLEAERSGRCPW